MEVARVIVDAPLPQPLDYAAGELGPAALHAGTPVFAPLGARSVAGIVVGRAAAPSIDVAKVRPLRALIADVAPLPDDWLQFTRFAADYYHCGWGEIAVPALPPALRKITGADPAKRVLALRKRYPGRAAESAPSAGPPVTLREEQRVAVDAIVAALGGFAPFLLFGVTGSGKTEVYLHAIAAALAADPAAQVLLLVPEINLTPQLEALLRSRFPGEPVVSQHSALADGERTAAWLQAHEGRARIVVGTRLAVFAAVPHLRLIVVDEEHDPSLKAGDGVRFSARDLAVKRAQMLRLPVVLGSATPSLESWAAAQAGRYRLLALAQRAGGAAKVEAPGAEGTAGGTSGLGVPGGTGATAESVGAPARVVAVDVRAHPPEHGLSGPLRSALAATVARGEQALVFINRRGYSPVLACDACGWLSNCPRCSTFAAYHKRDAVLRCHHCGWQQRVPRACPTCGNQDLQPVGQGTQRLEETLREMLPQARLARIDRDSTRRKGAAAATLDAVHAGDIDILVGTQMIAKGHDFRRVSLVCVLNADAQLLATDFRAPERLFATLAQVSGRAGRAGQPARVLLQTRYPDHPLYVALARHDFAGFARQQLAERRATHLPPFVHAALLTAQARAMETATTLLELGRELALPLAPQGMNLYDPVPMPLERVDNEHRAQMLIESPRRPALHAFLREWLPALRAAIAERKLRARWHLEVDPASI